MPNAKPTDGQDDDASFSEALPLCRDEKQFASNPFSENPETAASLIDDWIDA